MAKGGLKPTLRPAIHLICILIAAPTLAAPWDAVKGNWRTDQIASCGIDDVRAGRIMSVGDSGLRYGFVHCVIQSGEAAEDIVTVFANCDLGGGYEAALSYRWRFTGPHEAILSHEGHDRRLVRCEKGIE